VQEDRTMTSRTLIGAAVLAGALALAGCEGAGGDVSVLTSDTVALTGPGDFAWAPAAAGQSGDPRIDNDIIRGRIKSAIEANLAAKGFRQVSDPGQAQFLVAYHVGLRAGKDYQVNSTGPGPGPVACGVRGCIGGFGWGMYGAPSADVTAVNYTEGALMLDLVQAGTGKLVWRATSNKRVDRSDATEAGLNAIVADMTKTLPGSAAGNR
jgi:predicted small secreted protein